VDELEAHHAGDIRLQSFAPFWAEVRIVGGPQQERGMIEASEPVEQLERRLVVRGVECPARNRLVLARRSRSLRFARM